MKTEIQRRKMHSKRRGQRGQAMVEYGIINYLLIMALCFASTAPIFKTTTPAGEIENRNVIEMMLEAYQRYYDSYYLVLMMPYP